MPFHAITMADGSVAIMQTVADIDPADCIARWPASAQALVVSRTPIDPAAIPADRTFRDAWALSGGKLAPDMAKARDILRDRLRAARAPLLAALDEAYLRADETKDDATKASIAAAKQQLRKATGDASIAAAATLQDLVAISLTTIAPAAVAAATAAAAAADPNPNPNPSPDPTQAQTGTGAVDGGPGA
jgi:hypothetical protein